MADVLIRPATPNDAPAIARVRVESWRTTYKGMIPDTYLSGMNVEDSAALWHKVLCAGASTTSVFVAQDAAGIVGFASGNMLSEPKHGLDAELSAVYLVREAQRAGVGRRLVAHVAAAQRSFGATGLIVWVIAGNKPARAFYEMLDAELLIEQPFTWDGMDMLEAGYGWRDLDALVGTAGVSQPLH
jgi:GNAT superfamily N-acetyltransferase